MSEIDDAWIDEQLKSVPLPPELLERLRGVTSWGDAELDLALRNVPLPAAMLDRLHAIGSLTDTDIDDDARHIPLPSDVIPRLRSVMRREAWQTRLARLAVAASLVFVLGGGGWLLVKGLRQQEELPDGFKNPRIATNSGEQPKIQPGAKQPIRPADNTPQIVKSPDKHPVNLPEDPLPSPSPSPNVAVTPGPTSVPDDDPTNGRGEPDATLNPADVLGNSALVAQPELRVARRSVRHGVAGPRVKGYDLIFEFRYGEHPLVRPGDTKSLLESRVPIWTDTSSYEFAKRAAAARQPLPASQIRAEDFLAAMDYGFPLPAAGRIGVRTAAGPSPLGLPGMSLIQVGVQAGAFDRGQDSGTHMTLAIDVSSAMAVADRWTAVRKALGELAERLSPQDRVSIVLFNGKASTLVARADRGQLTAELEKLATIEPRGLANLAPALEMGTALVQRKTPADDGLSNRLVLVTDGLGWIDPTALPRMKELLKKTIAAGIRWEVIDVRPDDVSDPRLEELAAVSHGKVRHAETTRAIARELREALIGRRDVVASGISLKVTFNPEAVESYRLIGHLPTAAGGLLSGPLEGDLRAGEAATGLYEVELKPEGADTVATVEVSWHEPGTEEVHHLKQPIGRLQFAPSWMETPLSLQLAALSAETAAILRGSYFAPTGSRPTDQVLEWTDRANPALQSRECFRELRTILGAARPARPAGR